MKNEHIGFPERLRLRDTRLHDDMGGAGQRIYTTAGQGYQKQEYVIGDIVDLMQQRIEELEVVKAERDRLLTLATKYCPTDHHYWQEILRIACDT